MKKLCIILLMLITVSISAQDVPVNEEVISETERIVDKYGSKLVESFSEFMETATPMAQEGFKIVVRLQVAKGICRLLFIPLSLFFVWMFFKNLKQTFSPEFSDKDFNGGTTIVLCIFSAILGIISIITALFQTSTGLQMLIAPEWFAIKEIAELF